MKIIFDPEKNNLNIIKHGVGFDKVYNFDWNNTVIYKDERKDYGEERRIALGYIGGRLHVLIYTKRGDYFRIISLRKANKRERKEYEQRYNR